MGKIRTYAKHLLAHWVYHSGLFQTRLRKVEGRSLTLMYHRIVPRGKAGSFLQPGMYVEPETFDLQLRFLKKHFHVQPVSALYPLASSGARREEGKPSCALTFDDGWSDFYEYAFPLLVRHAVSATVFLPTGFIGTDKRFWTERLGQICAEVTTAGNFDDFKAFVRQLLSLQGRVQVMPVMDFQEVVLETLKKYREEAINEILGQLEKRFTITIPSERRDFLSWEQVMEMRRSGLVSFGSHTETHRLLTTLDQEEIYKEVTLSMHSLLERKAVEIECVTFCYPNGNFNDTAIAQVKAAGYSCAFTTRSGWNDLQTPQFALKRVGVHQDISSTEELFAFRMYSGLAQ